MGILDNKTRVFDTIITQEGKKQLSEGGIDISYVTYSDASTFYSADPVSGSADATKRIYFESCNLPQDQITFKSNDIGEILSISSIKLDKKIINGQWVDVYVDDNGKIVSKVIVGKDLVESSEDIISASADNFTNLMSIATIDEIFEDKEFSTNVNYDVFFNFVGNKNKLTSDLESINDITVDNKFSKSKNFDYLPPINKHVNGSVKVQPLGKYSPWYNTTSKPPDYLKEFDNCIQTMKDGYSKSIHFDPTSRNNNLAIQVFEVSDESIKKLDIIDFGEADISDYINYGTSNSTFYYNSISNNSNNSMLKRFFFVGKLLKKETINTYVFIHLFTIIFG